MIFFIIDLRRTKTKNTNSGRLLNALLTKMSSAQIDPIHTLLAMIIQMLPL